MPLASASKPASATDSLHTQPADTAHAVYTPLFETNDLKPLNQGPLIRSSDSSVWPAITLLVTFALIVFARVSEPRKFFRVFTSFYSLQASKQLLREDYKIGRRLSVVLLLVFLVSLSYLLYLLNRYFGLILPEWPALGQFGFFAGMVLAMYFVKYLFSMAVGYMINATELVKEYLFNVSVFAQVAGIAIFPFVIAIQFSKYRAEWFLYPAIVLVLAFFIFRLVRGFAISAVEQGIGFFYIFLYLCALEILPLLVLVKFLLTSF